jgi:hypothetical protein
MRPEGDAQSTAPTPGPWTAGKARLHFPDGRVEAFNDARLAYGVWLALPAGVRVAFRGPNDQRPVYPWDCVDRR